MAEETGELRQYTGVKGRIVKAVSVILPCYVLIFHVVDVPFRMGFYFYPQAYNAMFLALSLVMLFLLVPGSKNNLAGLPFEASKIEFLKKIAPTPEVGMPPPYTPGIPKDGPFTVSMNRNYLYVNKKLDETVAYTMAKVILEHAKELARVAPYFQEYNVRSFSKTPGKSRSPLTQTLSPSGERAG